ncbi:hypothetical protein D7Y05_01070 [bacterium 1XD42-54]|jgi:hypothetical protein|nr:hypothetical protein D7Y05_01070 [bacterium 1XD42-54]
MGDEVSYTIKKSHAIQILDCMGRVIFITRGSTLLVSQNAVLSAAPQNLSSDCNGVTGPDWGHSEVVFKWFHIKAFQLPPSLWMLPHFTLLVIVFSFASTVSYSIPFFFVCQGINTQT